MKSDFTGYVLVGGKSSRMGKDKYALEIGDETFLSRAVKTLAPVCASVKIVLNQTQNIETSLEIVRDVYPNRGALGGIHAALANCETKYAITLAVDLPFVTTGAIEKLTEFALASNKFLAFVPRQTDERIQPLCAGYRANYCLPTLEKLLDENESASVRDFLEMIYPKYIDQNCLSDDKDLLHNVNFPADLQKT